MRSMDFYYDITHARNDAFCSHVSRTVAR